MAELSAAATATAPTVCLPLSRKIGERRRAKLSNRERHTAEEAAGIILLVDIAFLIGHTVIGSADEILCGALDANDRENTDGGKKAEPILIVVERAGDGRCDPIGNVVAAAAATAAVTAGLSHADRKQDRIHDLYNANREIGRVMVGVPKIAGAD